jgi:hypothetical protein
MALDGLLVSLRLHGSAVGTTERCTGVGMRIGTDPLASAADGEDLESTVDEWEVLGFHLFGWWGLSTKNESGRYFLQVVMAAGLNRTGVTSFVVL